MAISHKIINEIQCSLGPAKQGESRSNRGPLRFRRKRDSLGCQEGGPASGFRKACRPRLAAESFQRQRHPTSLRTCCEGPFAEVLRTTGPMAKSNPFRFSTKYQDDETGLPYYGYRYYSASTGRWLNPDPIEEKGGRSLYVLVGNAPLNSVDPLGLEQFSKIYDHYDWRNKHETGPCCCPSGDWRSDISLSFSAAGATVSANAKVKLGKCAKLVKIYWFDCYTAFKEWTDAGSPGAADGFSDYGWTEGGASYSKTASPPWQAAVYDLHDSSHILLQAMLVYHTCINNIPHYVVLVDSGRFTWDWRKGHWVLPGVPVSSPPGPEYPPPL